MPPDGENLVVVQPTAQTVKVQSPGGSVTIAPAQQRVIPAARPPVTVQVTPTVIKETVADAEQVVIREQVQSVVRAGGGLQGPPGPPGPTGPPGDVTFVWTQAVPSALWVIPHNLQRYPSVTLVDSAGTVVMGNLQYQSPNQLTITLASAMGGVAYLN